MSRWTDPELRRFAALPGYRVGLGRALRRLKRFEAEARNESTPRDRRRSHRDGPAGRRYR